MPEFRPYVEDRAAWRMTSKTCPFLLYMDTNLPVRVDPSSGSLVLPNLLKSGPLCYDFILASLYTEPRSQEVEFPDPHHLHPYLMYDEMLLNDFVYGPTLDPPMYHLKSDQRLIVVPGIEKPICLYIWEDSVYDFPIFEPN